LGRSNFAPNDGQMEILRTKRVAKRKNGKKAKKKPRSSGEGITLKTMAGKENAQNTGRINTNEKVDRLKKETPEEGWGGGAPPKNRLALYGRAVH